MVGLAFLGLAAAAVGATAYSNLYVFGENLLAVPPGYSASNAGPSGAPMWVEDLAKQLGLGTPYFGPGQDNNLGLASQISTFIGSHGGSVDPDGLYVVIGGAKDILAPNTGPNAGANAAAAVVGQVGQLAAAGAQNILVGNLPSPNPTVVGPQAIDNLKKQIDAGFNPNLIFPSPLPGKPPAPPVQPKTVPLKDVQCAAKNNLDLTKCPPDGSDSSNTNSSADSGNTDQSGFTLTNVDPTGSGSSDGNTSIGLVCVGGINCALPDGPDGNPPGLGSTDCDPSTSCQSSNPVFALVPVTDSVPEPSALGLVVLALLGLGATRGMGRGVPGLRRA